jgi:RecA-family ATPase
MADKKVLTPGERTQLLANLKVEDSRLAEALERKWRAELAEDPTRPPVQGLISGYDVLTTDWPEPTWAVKDFFPVGMTLVAGAGKIGKSFWALQIAQAVAGGGRMFGREVEQGRVLYLALEDVERRFKDRMLKQGWGMEAAKNLTVFYGRDFSSEFGGLENGGSEKLERLIQWGGYRLTIVDTFSRSIFVDQNDKLAVTRALAPLHLIANEENMVVVIIDHHNKLGSTDAIKAISGSTAKGEIADTVIGIFRERGKAGARLFITGRELIDAEYDMFFDYDTCCWQCDEHLTSITLTEKHQEILAALEDLGEATLMETVAAVDWDKGNTYKYLQALVNEGLIFRKGQGKGTLYSIADPSL